MIHKDFTLGYGGAGYYYAYLTDDPEYGTPFVVRAPSDAQAWKELKELIDAESCAECGKYMKDEEHNYGTPEIWVCGHCYYDEQTPIEMPEWYEDLYTDASGNCFSDADSGL